MDRFINTLKSHAAALDRRQGQPRFALVTSVDPNAYVARVTLQPEDVLTGWLPILSPWVGNGWGLVCLPSPGDQVLVISQEGDAEHGVIIGATFSNLARPPTSAAGELHIVHSACATISLLNDGTVSIAGDVHVAGDIFDRHGSLAALRAHYNAHIHPGAAVSPPSPQD